ncbi:MAG: hypothetical protein K8R69_11195, partial [Deltaproteobacteria bacterium]|nr:hypothetical protein [Deltaproteobacteria bacterium]
AHTKGHSFYGILDENVKADYEKCVGTSLTGNLDQAKIAALTEEMHVGDTNCYNPAFHEVAAPHDGTIAPLLKIFWWSGKTVPRNNFPFKDYVDQLGLTNYNFHQIDYHYSPNDNPDYKGLYLGFEYPEFSVVRDLNRDQQKEVNYGVVHNKAVQCQNAADHLDADTNNSNSGNGTIHLTHPIQFTPPSNTNNSGDNGSAQGNGDTTASTDAEAGNGNPADAGDSKIAVTADSPSDILVTDGQAADGNAGCSLQKSTLSSNSDAWGIPVLLAVSTIWSKRRAFKRG